MKPNTDHAPCFRGGDWILQSKAVFLSLHMNYNGITLHVSVKRTNAIHLCANTVSMLFEVFFIAQRFFFLLIRFPERITTDF